MRNSVSVTTHESFGHRLQGSCQNLVVGPILFVIGLILLIWNEQHAVNLHRSLEYGRTHVIPLANASVYNPDRVQGKLVHMIGTAEAADDNARDELFGLPTEQATISTPGSKEHTQHLRRPIQFQRTVEMYQWQEHSEESTKKNTGGSTTTTTTYTYDRTWSSSLLNSNSFYESESHVNPDDWLVPPATFRTGKVTLGAYTLQDSIIQKKMNWWSDFRYFSLSVDSISDATLRSRATVHGNQGYYVSPSVNTTVDPVNPNIGDTRVSFRIVPSQMVSIIASPTGPGILTAYSSPAIKSPILLIQPGAHDADSMFQQAIQEATVVTYVLRILGTVLLYVGLRTVVEPLVTLADVLPILGNLVGCTASAVLTPVAIGIALVVICVSWIVVRPVWALSLLVGTVAGGGWWMARARQQYNAKKEEGENSDSIPVAQVLSVEQLATAPMAEAEPLMPGYSKGVHSNV